jgi:UDP-N-acetyl-D-mannosaminuronic acid dehydrogenase
MSKPVTIIGLGYIGLPTAAVIASRGIDVVGVDTDAYVVDTVNRGEIHIVEPFLDAVVRQAVVSGKLRAELEPRPASTFVVAVPTPITKEKKADMLAVYSAADALAPVLQTGDLVILESTSPVGSTERLSDHLASRRRDLTFPTKAGEASDIRVAYCPERVLPGKILEELVSNDRAIGGITPLCTKRAIDFYRQFVNGELIATTARTAELCKLSENAFRDVNIAFANELANVSERLGVDVWELIALANRHPRVNILKPGPGVGGHCIAVDPWFIAESAPDITAIIPAARRVNDARPEKVLALVRKAAGEFTARPTIACLGLAFKANVDDVRESPALEVVETLASERTGRILVVEPHLQALPAHLAHGGVELTDLATALVQSQVVLILVDHDHFRQAVRDISAHSRVIDTRGLLYGLKR